MESRGQMMVKCALQGICKKSVINEIEVTMTSNVALTQLGKPVDENFLQCDSSKSLEQNMNIQTSQVTEPQIQSGITVMEEAKNPHTQNMDIQTNQVTEPQIQSGINNVMEEAKDPHTQNMDIQTNQVTEPQIQSGINVMEEAKNPHTLQESDFSVGCSQWKTITDMNNESHLKLRLRKVNNKHEEILSSDSVPSEVDDTDADPDFPPVKKGLQFKCTRLSTDSSEDELFVPRRPETPANWLHNIDQFISSDSEEEPPEIELANVEKRKGKKKRSAPAQWSRNKKKLCRNKGEAYLSNSKNPKEIAARQMKAPCTDKCKLKCYTKINQESRQVIFDNYWKLANLQLQREFVSKLLTEIKPTYVYKREGSTRSANQAFHLVVNEKKIRVCKLFFKNTLGINDRPIRTVLNKNKDCIIQQEMRGKHGNQKTVDCIVKEGIREHINSIPRIESHYLRAQTTREFIEGGKSIASIHRDYVKKCEEQNIHFGNITMFTRIFNDEFNISFFTPKKDQCELCAAYNIAQGIDKDNLTEQYNGHLKEKDLSRIDKKKDKELALEKKSVVVATYDLQAVLPAPRGEVSVFYYKSKLNSYNLTVTELDLKNVNCYFWHEGEGKRGAIEIGTCVYKFLQTTALEKNDDDLEIIFYSDNCCGQQKNSFVFGMYLYAVQTLKIKSITHKFLIRGHTQNEGDNVHSIIEKSVKKALKSGPIYTPDEYIRIIRSSKVTGRPYKVTEFSHKDFIDWKTVTNQIGTNFTTISIETDAACKEKGILYTIRNQKR